MSTATKLARADFAPLFAKAAAAGKAAADAAIPAPMIVSGYENDPVMDGVCGFAWVNIKPGTSAFARYLKAQGLARTDSYYGGVSVWISYGGQSYTRKYAYASAFAAVLNDAGIKAFAMSRLD